MHDTDPAGVHHIAAGEEGRHSLRTLAGVVLGEEGHSRCVEQEKQKSMPSVIRWIGAGTSFDSLARLTVPLWYAWKSSTSSTLMGLLVMPALLSWVRHV